MSRITGFATQKLSWRQRLALSALAVAALLPGASHGQQTNDQLAARCAELGALFDRFGTRRGEGSGGPDMTRLGAGIDCQRDATSGESARSKDSFNATGSPSRRAEGYLPFSLKSRHRRMPVALSSVAPSSCFLSSWAVGRQMIVLSPVAPASRAVPPVSLKVPRHPTNW